jgi:hypothetical protein
VDEGVDVGPSISGLINEKRVRGYCRVAHRGLGVRRKARQPTMWILRGRAPRPGRHDEVRTPKLWPGLNLDVVMWWVGCRA